MTTMDDYVKMDIRARRMTKFKPLGKSLYNGFGYLISDSAWGASEVIEFYEWSREYGCVFDGPVCMFPDDDTYILARMIWE